MDNTIQVGDHHRAVPQQRWCGDNEPSSCPPGANCKKQLKELIEFYELPCRVLGLHDLILKAIEIPGCKSPLERKREAELLEI